MMTRATPAKDLFGMKFSGESVWTIVRTVLMVGTIIWSTRSDNKETRLLLEVQNRELRTALQHQNEINDERYHTMQDSLSNQTKQQTLQGYDITDLKVALAQAGIYKGHRP